MDEIPLIARQPIYDDQVNVIAYELLFRQGNSETADVTDGDAASSQVLINAFTELDFDELVGSKKAYINFTRKLLMNPPPFDKSRYVIEVLESEKIDDQLIACCQQLSDQGYVIALDDFVIGPDSDKLLQIADIVKLDVLALPKETIAEYLDHLHHYNLKIVAEKVETHELYEACLKMGFDMFQGFFLSRPQLISGRHVPASKMIVMQLLVQLQDPDINVGDLADLITQDPVLSYKILRVINSASHKTMAKIESINRAITYLGLNHIRSLASLLALSHLSDKPQALRVQTIIRAKMCEILGSHLNDENDSVFFSIGLLSNLDAYFDQQLEDIVRNLPLSDEILAGILHHAGPCGFILSTVLAHERGDWEQIDWPQLEQLGITTDNIKEAYQESIAWSENPQF